jgi:hypothetical protein
MTHYDQLRAANEAVYAALRTAPQDNKAALTAMARRLDDLVDQNAPTFTETAQ